VTVAFGLFTRIGGARAAIATLLVGLVTYQAGSWLDLTAPYVVSVLASLGVYLGVSAFERGTALAPAP
jgi:hypothetical protein